MGAFALTIAYVYVFETIATGGLPPVIVRGVSTDERSAGTYLKASLLLGLLLSAGAQALLLASLWFMDYSEEVEEPIRLLGWSIGFMVLTQYIQAVFEGYQRMFFRSALSLFEIAARTAAGVAALAMGWGITGVIQGFVLVRALMFLLAISVAVWALPLKLDRSFEWSRCASLLREAGPFFFTTIIAALYWHVDILMLSRWGTIETVGSYNAAFRLMAILKGLTYTYLIALLPVVSESFIRSTAAFRKDCESSLKYLVLVTLPAAAGTTILAEPIIERIYGAEFSDAALVLGILIWTVCFFPVALVFSRALIASHNQRLDLYCNVVGLLINVALNAMLLPRFGAVGAAIATLTSILLFMCMQHFAVSKAVFQVSLSRFFLKPALATIPLVAVALCFRDAPLWLSIPSGAAAYGGAILLVGGLSKQELAMAQAALRHGLARKVA